jgi:hypothetical protein
MNNKRLNFQKYQKCLDFIQDIGNKILHIQYLTHFGLYIVVYTLPGKDYQTFYLEKYLILENNYFSMYDNNHEERDALNEKIRRSSNCSTLFFSIIAAVCGSRTSRNIIRSSVLSTLFPLEDWFQLRWPAEKSLT